jgi:hypothetical protein
VQSFLKNPCPLEAIEIGAFVIDQMYGQPHFLQEKREVAVRRSDVSDFPMRASAQLH